MSDLNAMVREYQKKSKVERLELLRLELPRKKMVELLIEFQQPTKQRRISAKLLAHLLTHFERNWGEVEEFFERVEGLKMSIDAWCQLRAEAEKMPAKERKAWQKAFDVTAKLRSDVLVQVAGIIPRVRVSVVGYDSANTEDLDGVGYMSLIKALENFDADRGVPFEAYARSWGYNSMIQYLRKDKLVNASEKVLRAFRMYDQTITEIEAKLGRKAEDFEIAEAMNISTADLESLLAVNTSTTSLDAAVSEEEEGATLHEMLSTEEAAPYMEMESKALAHSLQQHMKKLSQSELSIVLLRWFPLKHSDLKGQPMSIDLAIMRMQELALERMMLFSVEGKRLMKKNV